MSFPDSSKQDGIEEFLRKSLLGEELVNTQFHLFSARSSTSDRVVKSRVLCANNILLAKSSRYFVDYSSSHSVAARTVLSSDIHPSDPSLSDLTGDNDMPNDIRVDEYGYASDSDLDDEEEEEQQPIRVIETEAQKDRPRIVSMHSAMQPKDDEELSDDGSESVSSDMFVMSPEHPSVEPPLLVNAHDAPSSISRVALGNTTTDLNDISMRLRSLGSRHILVKDTAFQTWYTLLNYLYTGKFNFLPLSSATRGGQSYVSSTSARDEPECSAKSMYRLACKVGIDHLRDEAMAHIRSNLSENNILQEISCSLVSTHPELLEMELDVLYTHIESLPVETGFRALAQRIALRELPHGADIVVGIHTRVLKERRSVPPTPTPVLEPAPDSLRPYSPPPPPDDVCEARSPSPPLSEKPMSPPSFARGTVDEWSTETHEAAPQEPKATFSFGFPQPPSATSRGWGSLLARERSKQTKEISTLSGPRLPLLGKIASEINSILAEPLQQPATPNDQIVAEKDLSQEEARIHRVKKPTGGVSGKKKKKVRDEESGADRHAPVAHNLDL